MAINFDGKSNVACTTEDGVIAVKLYSLEKQIDDLKSQLQQKENIIKEAREYVNKMWLAKLTPDTVSQTKFELLEILDKGE